MTEKYIGRGQVFQATNEAFCIDSWPVFMI